MDEDLQAALDRLVSPPSPGFQAGQPLSVSSLTDLSASASSETSDTQPLFTTADNFSAVSAPSEIPTTEHHLSGTLLNPLGLLAPEEASPKPRRSSEPIVLPIRTSEASVHKEHSTHQEHRKEAPDERSAVNLQNPLDSAQPRESQQQQQQQSPVEQQAPQLPSSHTPIPPIPHLSNGNNGIPPNGGGIQPPFVPAFQAHQSVPLVSPSGSQGLAPPFYHPPGYQTTGGPTNMSAYIIYPQAQQPGVIYTQAPQQTVVCGQAQQQQPVMYYCFPSPAAQQFKPPTNRPWFPGTSNWFPSAGAQQAQPGQMYVAEQGYIIPPPMLCTPTAQVANPGHGQLYYIVNGGMATAAPAYYGV
ncbi:hypothetical protein GGR57DRAFT_474254 [Xylariaceae sp. FL1272]|nr:hypothetical protein GGR57DRAFT_474254 [Xylariaceae sp. FL1272]